MPPNPVVAAAIVDSLEHPTLLLAAERSYPKSLAGMFELPGGKIDGDEDAEDALFREIREELGVNMILGNPVPATTAALTKMMEEERAIPANGPEFAPWPILQDRVMWVWFAELVPERKNRCSVLISPSSGPRRKKPSICHGFQRTSRLLRPASLKYELLIKGHYQDFLIRDLPQHLHNWLFVTCCWIRPGRIQ